MSNTYIYNIEDEWNDSNTIYNSLKINVTDTASNYDSKLLNLQINNNTMFNVDKNGMTTTSRYVTNNSIVIGTDIPNAYSTPIQFDPNWGYPINAYGQIVINHTLTDDINNNGEEYIGPMQIYYKITAGANSGRYTVLGYSNEIEITAGSKTVNMYGVYGQYQWVRNFSNSSIPSMTGNYIGLYSSGSNTITSSYSAFFTGISLWQAANVTTSYTVYITPGARYGGWTGNVASCFGLYIVDHNNKGANSYNLYSAGSGKNYFGGLSIFNSGIDVGGNVILTREADNVLALRNNNNPQKLSVYYNYTDSSNYTRLAIKTASEIHSLEAESAGTGQSNVDIAFVPKGAGLIKYGTHSAIGSETISGYITIKDSSGTIRKLAVIS